MGRGGFCEREKLVIFGGIRDYFDRLDLADSEILRTHKAQSDSAYPRKRFCGHHATPQRGDNPPSRRRPLTNASHQQTRSGILRCRSICGWLAFACTALITIVAGYFGKRLATDPAAPTSTDGLPQGPTRTIALLAALATVLTAGGNLAINRGHDDYAKADSARATINQSVGNLAVAKDEREARDVLGFLEDPGLDGHTLLDYFPRHRK